MARVRDDATKKTIELGVFADQQWELFRRVREDSSLNLEVIKLGIRALINHDHVVGLKYFHELRGLRIVINRYTLGFFVSLLGCDGSKVEQRRFPESEWIEAREGSRNLIKENGFRAATPLEAIGYIVSQKSFPSEYMRWGMTSWRAGDGNNHWVISFEESKSDITVNISQLNWEYMSKWAHDCPVLVVKV